MTLKNQSQTVLKPSGSKTIDTSPTGARLIANESTATMIKKSKYNNEHARSKSLIKPASKGLRNSSSMHRTFSLYGLTSNASTKYLFGEPSRRESKKLANINNFTPGEAANKFYYKNIIQALEKFT